MLHVVLVTREQWGKWCVSPAAAATACNSNSCSLHYCRTRAGDASTF